MVRGLARFKKHFQGFERHFVVIGGAACDAWLTSRGMEFRRTRDIDLVLIAERLDRIFAARFREFVAAGGYRHVSRTSGKPVYYRFTEPESDEYPEMLELFSRRPTRLALAPNRQVARLEAGVEPVSLSAILLDDTYYSLVQRYRVEEDGLPRLGPGALIPMKAWAWLNLTSRRAAGERVDEDDIRKHRNDVFRLMLSLTGEERFAVPTPVVTHLREFLAALPPESPEWNGIRSALRTTFRGGIDSTRLTKALAISFGLQR